MKRILKANLVFAVLLTAACIDSPSAPLASVDAAPLATSFEALAEEMRTTDTERSEELRWAAIAVRSGVTPSVLEVTNNGVPELYDAFVHAVRWVSMDEAIRPVAHRNLVAWRRTGGVLQVLLVGMAADSAPVLHPFSLRPTSSDVPSSPILGAKAAYFERTQNAGASWIGIGGVAKIVESSAGTPCGQVEDSARPPGVACQRSTFDVTLSIELARTPTRDSRDVPVDAPTRWLHAPDQSVAAVKLLFSCSAPTATGCN